MDWRTIVAVERGRGEPEESGPSSKLGISFNFSHRDEFNAAKFTIPWKCYQRDISRGWLRKNIRPHAVPGKNFPHCSGIKYDLFALTRSLQKKLFVSLMTRSRVEMEKRNSYFKGIEKKAFSFHPILFESAFFSRLYQIRGDPLDVVFQISSRPDAFTTVRVHSPGENLIDAPLSTYPLLGTPLRALLPKPTSLERGQISYFVSRRRQMVKWRAIVFVWQRTI